MPKEEELESGQKAHHAVVESPDDAVRRMAGYITLAFRNVFPSADRIGVGFVELAETWVVAVDGAAYAMTIGSDDDEFSFHCASSPHLPRVSFPLAPEDRPDE